jgi:hypothetical protein
MAKQPEHLRHIMTKEGRKGILINPGVPPRSQVPAPSSVSMRPSAALKERTAQMVEDFTSSAAPQLSDSLVGHAVFVHEVAKQEQRITEQAREMVDIGISLREGTITVQQAQQEVRKVMVTTEQTMAAVEYAASRLPEEFQHQIAVCHAELRECSIDALGYLIDVEDNATIHAEGRTAKDFEEAAAYRVYTSARINAQIVNDAAAQELSYSFLRPVQEDFEQKVWFADRTDSAAFEQYVEAKENLINILALLQETTRRNVSGATDAIGELHKVVTKGGNRADYVRNVQKEIEQLEQLHV